MNRTGTRRRRGDARTVAERLRDARRRRFVGRVGELELFRSALAATEPPFTVLFVYGPGGIGKTVLLDALASVAEEAGGTPVRVDARPVEPSPPAFLDALGAALDLPEGEPPLGALAEGRRYVVLLDTYEAIASIEEWLRERFLPDLPDDVLVVIASRSPPSAAWTSDPGWRELLRVVSLRNLQPEDSRAYLRAEEIPDVLHDRVLAATHGHPLALSLLVDVLRQGDRRERPQGGVGIELGDAPDVVRTLLGRFVDEVPSPRHRGALEVCAHAPFTTEELLHDVLGGDDVGELLDWLRRLSFTDEGTPGVFPHDLARDVLDADLQWRDRAAHAQLHRRVQAHLLRRIRETAGTAQRRAVTEMVFFQRSNPPFSDYWDWATLGQQYADVLRPGDRGPVLGMAERHQGREAAAIAEYWMDRQPRAFVVVRDHYGEPIGFGALLRLHEATPDDLAADPGARAVWEYAQRHGPARPGEDVTALRFFVDKDAYQQPSASFNVITIHHVLHILRSPRLAWDFFAAHEGADQVAPMFTYLGYHRAPDADYEVAGRRYRTFARDWRQLSVDRWLDMLCEGKLGEPEGSASLPPAPVLVLSQAEFAAAVRQALRDLHRRDALGRNPLLRSRLVRDRAGGSPADVLAEAVRRAAEATRADPRDEKLHRAVDRTYLRPAQTQEGAAEVLGLPFSTYRRHLNAGIGRIVELLWQQELYGPSEQEVSNDRSGG